MYLYVLVIQLSMDIHNLCIYLFEKYKNKNTFIIYNYILNFQKF